MTIKLSGANLFGNSSHRPGSNPRPVAARYLATPTGFTLRTYTRLVPSSFERARLAIADVFGLKSVDGLEAA